MPYSQKACEDAINKIGLQKGGRGYSFSGSKYSRKGCYAYKRGLFANMAFYGLGGSEKQNKKPLHSPKYRPEGHDCSTTGIIQQGPANGFCLIEKIYL